jgi:uncharacterized Fe-S cluster protein YjdI/CDGSH-type Zn-finger protein
MAAKDYAGTGIVVHWDAAVCIHSARCVAALPQVFRPTERPWILAGAANTDDVAAAVHQCPSGALRYTREESPMTESAATPAPVVVTVSTDGPNLLAGPIEIRNEAGDLVKTASRVALCRCGASENKPFCDGSHKRVGFTDPGPSAPPAQA